MPSTKSHLVVSFPSVAFLAYAYIRVHLFPLCHTIQYGFQPTVLSLPMYSSVDIYSTGAPQTQFEWFLFPQYGTPGFPINAYVFKNSLQTLHLSHFPHSMYFFLLSVLRNVDMFSGVELVFSKHTWERPGHLGVSKLPKINACVRVGARVKIVCQQAPPKPERCGTTLQLQILIVLFLWRTGSFSLPHILYKYVTC